MSESFPFGGGAKINLAYVEPGTLTITISGTTPTISLANTGTDSGGLLIGHFARALLYAGSSTSAPAFQVRKANGSSTSPTAIASGDEVGRYTFGGYGATTFFNTAHIRAYATEAWTDSAQGTELRFEVTPSTTTTVRSAWKLTNAGQLLGVLATSALGYGTGAGGTATQGTNRSTGVTVSPNPCLSGTITTDTTSLAAEASATFTVTNSAVAIGDTVVVSQRSGSNGGNTDVTVKAVASGTFDLMVSNNNAGGGAAETGAIIVNFAILKAVSA